MLDLASPGLIEMMKQSMGDAMKEAGAPFLFAPAEGPPFFAAYGWQPIEVRPLLKTAAKLERLPLALRMFAMLPESDGAQGESALVGGLPVSRARSRRSGFGDHSPIL